MKNGGSFHSFLYVYQRVTSDTRPLRCLGTSMVPRHGVASLRNSARSGSTGQPGWWRLVIWQLARLGAGEGVKENPLVSLKLGWASPQIRPSLGTFYGKKTWKKHESWDWLVDWWNVEPRSWRKYKRKHVFTSFSKLCGFLLFLPLNITIYTYVHLPVVPHKAVAEVSE